jgi:hypothetical protein
MIHSFHRVFSVLKEGLYKAPPLLNSNQLTWRKVICLSEKKIPWWSWEVEDWILLEEEEEGTEIGRFELWRGRPCPGREFHCPLSHSLLSSVNAFHASEPTKIQT